MIPFQTTPQQRLQAAKLAVSMAASGLSEDFVGRALELASTDQGVFELMELWGEADNPHDRDEAIADIQEAIEEAAEDRQGILQKPRLDFDRLDGVVASIVDHKKRIRQLIDQAGGVSQVARLSGIPQPSLSRMLNSASMPRRSTLFKIARALDVEESEIVTEWWR